jgi:WD40 repeat protein
MTPAPNSCPDADRLCALVEGTLPAAEEQALVEHLETCPRCQDHLEGLAAATKYWSVAAKQRARTLIERRAPGRSPTEVPPELAQHPRYRVKALLGAGGMGAVYRAEHRLMERPVALKVIHADLLKDPVLVRRFRSEVKAAARLAHPNIVAAYDAEQAGGVHFLVMEFVEGVTLARVVARRGPLPAGAACDYARQAALGLQHAHEKGMVHRDVKPQNLMLTPAGQVKVLDFGLARLARRTNLRRLTEVGEVMGTPDYIAPEQATDSSRVDIRADVYSLGCTLFFLITGRPPFPDGSVEDKLHAHLRQPPPPLTGVPAPLARVVERMLAKSPGQRYQTPAEVAQALAPFAQADNPAGLENPQAGPDAPTFVPAPEPARRRRAVVFAVVGVGLVTAGLTIALLLSGTAGVPEPVRKSPPKPPPDPVADTSPFAALRPEQIPADVLALAGAGDPKATPPELVGVFGDGRLMPGGVVMAVAFSPDGRRLASAGHDFFKVWDVETGFPVPGFRDPGTRTNATAFSPDGKFLAAGDAKGEIRLWEAATGREVRVLKGHMGAVNGLAFSPDSQHLASAGKDRTVKVWEVASGETSFTFTGHVGVVHSVAFSPDAKVGKGGRGRLASSGGAELADKQNPPARVVAWDVATGKEVLSLVFENVLHMHAVAFSPTGNRLAGAGSDSAVRVWDVEARKEPLLLKVQGGAVRGLAFSPDGKRLACVGADEKVYLWEVAGGKPLPVPERRLGRLLSVAFSPEGSRIATGGVSGAVRIWDARTGTETLSRRGHAGQLTSLALSPDGTWLVTGGADATARVWDTRTGQARFVLQDLRPEVVCVAVSPDGRRIATVNHFFVRLWDAGTSGHQLTFQGHKVWVLGLAFSPDGKHLVSGGFDGKVKRWEALTGKEVREWDHPDGGRRVAFSRDGNYVASVASGRRVKVWEVASGAELSSPKVKGLDDIAGISFSPDGEHLLVTGHGALPRMINVKSGQEDRQVRGEPGDYPLGVYSAGGRFLIGVRGAAERLVVWEVATGEVVRQIRLPASAGVVRDLAVTPDDRHVVTANANGTVFVFRLQSHQGP